MGVTHSATRFTAARVMPALYRVVVGAVGSLILVFFLAGLMPVGKTVGFMPWIIGFNAALTGYTILDKAGSRFARRPRVVLISGAAMVILTFVALNIISLYLTGFYLLSAGDLILLLVIGILCSGIGGWLAVKYFNLKSSTGGR